MPMATTIMSGSIETIPTQPSAAVAEVDVALAPAADAVLAAHVVAEDLASGVDAPDEVRAEVADAASRPRSAGASANVAPTLIASCPQPS